MRAKYEPKLGLERPILLSGRFTDAVEALTINEARELTTQLVRAIRQALEQKQ